MAKLCMHRFVWFAAIFCLLCVAPVSAAERATPNDTARFLAGLEPSKGSPLEAMSELQAWKNYARTFDAVWAKVEERQLGPIRAWRETHLATPQKTMFYMFSGPDFLYANATYPLSLIH